MADTAHDPFSALRFKEFRFFIAARLTLTLGFQVQAIVINWLAYDLTRDPWILGIMGLVEALPIIVVSLFGGHYADKYNRRNIILLFTGVLMAGALSMAWITRGGLERISTLGMAPIFALVFVIGFSRGFLSPAVISFAAQLIPKKLYTNAATWNSSVWQLGAVAGPALGGLSYAWWGPSVTSVVALGMMGITVVLYFFIKPRPRAAGRQESMRASLASGIRFVFRNQAILSAITLDMFAVLFGGAVAMLPVFADQVLHTGPDGLGYLRAAPALGAILMAAWLAYHPPLRHPGRTLLTHVALFGVSMIAFALSRNFWLSFTLLLLSGMFDNVSVVIRHTIVQTLTPDEMRGRVSSVNSIFIGASNEIGAFESGLAARLMGLIPSVIFGGAMTLAVVASTFRFAPSLKKLRFDKPSP
jgi:MFS family permease